MAFFNLFNRDNSRRTQFGAISVDGQAQYPLTSHPTTYYDLFESSTDSQSCMQEIAKRLGSSAIQVSKKNDPTHEALTLDDYQTWLITRFFMENKYRMARDLLVGGDLILNAIPSQQKSKFALIDVIDPRDVDITIGNNWQTVVSIHGQPGNIIEGARRYRMTVDTKESSRGMSVLNALVADLRADKNLRDEFSKTPSVLANIDLNKLDPTKSMPETEIQNSINKIVDLFTRSIRGSSAIASTILDSQNPLVKIDTASRQEKAIELRRYLLERICASFGVPKSILGYTDGINYATADILYKRFISSTIEPLNLYLAHALTDFYQVNNIIKKDEVVILEGESVLDTYEWHKDQREDIKAGILSVDEVKDERK